MELEITLNLKNMTNMEKVTEILVDILGSMKNKISVLVSPNNRRFKN